MHVGTIGHEIKNDDVIQPQEGDQGQVGGPQVLLPGHGVEIESLGLEIENDVVIQPLEGGQRFLRQRGLGYVTP